MMITYGDGANFNNVFAASPQPTPSCTWTMNVRSSRRVATLLTSGLPDIKIRMAQSVGAYCLILVTATMTSSINPSAIIATELLKDLSVNFRTSPILEMMGNGDFNLNSNPSATSSTSNPSSAI